MAFVSKMFGLADITSQNGGPLATCLHIDHVCLSRRCGMLTLSELPDRGLSYGKAMTTTGKLESIILWEEHKRARRYRSF